jgi:VWFA-related protein
LNTLWARGFRDQGVGTQVKLKAESRRILLADEIRQCHHEPSRIPNSRRQSIASLNAIAPCAISRLPRNLRVALRVTLSLTALNDLANAQKDVLGRVIVIWIGPGWPLQIGPEFHPDTAQVQANFFDHIVQLSRTLREAQLTVDAVYSPEIFQRSGLQSVHAKSFADGPLTEKQATAGDLALQAIATQSGGRILESKSIAAQIARCVADVQTYYALSFDSIPSSKPNEYHSLQVKVNKSGVKAFTNTLYYGEP